MDDLVRFGVSMDSRLLKQFDKYINQKGYANRSEAIRDLIRSNLVEEEWKPIRSHPELGVEILRHVIDLVNCLPAILHHHEHYDGRGYPSGLRKDKIPLEARILAVADAYDAMTSPRPYRQQLSSDKAIKELRRCAGSQFDPEMVGAFCSIIQPSRPKSLGLKREADKDITP